MKRCLSFLKNYIDRERVKTNIKGPLSVINNDYNFVIDNIEAKPGIYIIVSKKHKFVYPKGNSSVIYIGKASNLKRRIKEHLNNLSKVSPKEFWVYNRYNYMRMEGGFEIYYLTTIKNENPKYMESRAIEDFYDSFLAIPVGNGAFSFR